MIVWRDATTLPGSENPSGDDSWDAGRGVVLLEELLARLDQVPAQRPVAIG